MTFCERGCRRRAEWGRLLFGFLVVMAVSGFSPEVAKSDADKAWGQWHRIRRGDTVWGIANRYQVSVEAILRANRIASVKRLPVGGDLFIPGLVPSEETDGIWHKIRKGDTLWDISRANGVTVKTLMHVNKLRSATRLQVGTTLFVPSPNTTGFRSPLPVALEVTSSYGYRLHPISRKRAFHHGVDFRARPGTRVYAAKSGKVARSGWYGGYGNVVVIEHPGEYATWYGHLSKIWVKAGQTVKRGQVVGTSGSSGYATGPHLHFEIRWKDKSVDAVPYLSMP